MGLQALIDTLNALNGVHEVLVQLAEQKKQVLIYNRVDELTQLVNKENRLLKQIVELEQQRIERIGNFLMEKGYRPNPKVTISDLSKIIFDRDEKKALLDTQKQLLATIRQLRELNAVNQQLIEQSLAFIDYSLDLFVGPPEDEVIYHNPQSSSGQMKRPGLFDTKA